MRRFKYTYTKEYNSDNSDPSDFRSSRDGIHLARSVRQSRGRIDGRHDRSMVDYPAVGRTIIIE